MMDELNALIAPKKVVDGLTEVFEGLAHMFEGVSDQLDQLGADATLEDKPLRSVVDQEVPAVSEKKCAAAPHPRKKPVKKTKNVDEVASAVTEDKTPEVPVVEETPAEDAVNAESSETADAEHPVDDADALPWAEDTGQKEAPADKAEPAAKAEAQPAVTITKDDITAVIVAKIRKKRDNNEKIGQLLKTYGVAQLSDLPAEKYEAFLADVSQI